MTAIYSKNNGKIMISKQIESFEVNHKTKMVTIYYQKNGELKSKVFAPNRQIFIKDNGYFVFNKRALYDN